MSLGQVLRDTTFSLVIVTNAKGTELVAVFIYHQTPSTRINIT